MNNYCRHCGYKLKKRVRKCANCGTSIINERYDIKKHFRYRKNEFICSVIILSLFMIRVVLLFFESNNSISITGDVLTILILLSTISAKVQFNESKFINYLFYGVYLLISIFIIISFVISNYF